MSIRNMMIGGAGATAPDAPTGVSAGSATATTMSVSFSAPANNGGSAITGFTVTSSPGGLTATGASSPLTVTGLTQSTSYTFTVTATNAIGTSPASSPSSAVSTTTPATRLPANIAQSSQTSGWLQSPTGTINGVAYRIITSSAHGLGSSTATDSHNYYVTDNLGWYWYIAANWGYGTPSRWSSVNFMGFAGSGAVVSQNSPSYTTFDSIPIYNANMNGTNVTSGTAAGAIGFSNDYNSSYSSLKPGSFQYDAQNFSNSSGAGFANWYGDGNKAAQAYSGINSAAYGVFGGSNPQIGQFDSPSSGQGSDDGGSLWWRPPLLTKEVSIDFGNSHSNGRCAVWCWDNNTGTMKWVINYGNYAAINTGAGALNDSATRTVIAAHTEGFVYFNGDYAGTIAGSHYYLYR